MNLRLLVCVGLGVIGSSVANADALAITPQMGYHHFDTQSQVNTRQELSAHSTQGLSLMYGWSPSWELELGYRQATTSSYQPTPLSDIDWQQRELNIVHNYMTGTRWQPFTKVGFGEARYKVPTMMGMTGDSLHREYWQLATGWSWQAWSWLAVRGEVYGQQLHGEHWRDYGVNLGLQLSCGCLGGEHWWSRRKPSARYLPVVETDLSKLDSDHDGVANNLDMCPYTSAGIKVDIAGCPADIDRDHVLDYLDKCPDTPPNVSVNADGCPVDTDKDGIPDYEDKCANTPLGARVDTLGCVLDADGDGVTDNTDKCPNTPKGSKVDNVGCLLDGDKDGVPDDKDKCPTTPVGAKVYDNGCAVDSDNDGVIDFNDKCPNTPSGVKVDGNGCPYPAPAPAPAPAKNDGGNWKGGNNGGNWNGGGNNGGGGSGGGGAASPVNVNVTNNNNIYPNGTGIKDEDGDGIADADDKCPNTPKGSKVDNKGCVLAAAPIGDNDHDGVPDDKDQCPNTPAGDKVDSKGCSVLSGNKDSDHDGVPDDKDKCPRTPEGAKVDPVGCPQKLAEDVSITLNVLFDTDKANIIGDAQNDIQKVATFMREYPEVNVTLEGHTDNRASVAHNLRLSKRRADAVKLALVKLGVNPRRLKTVGYGLSQPIADNTTEAGQALNRRVVATAKAQTKIHAESSSAKAP